MALTPFHVTPKRKTEGYGLTKEVLERGLKLGAVDLVIALGLWYQFKEEAEFLHEED